MFYLFDLAAHDLYGPFMTRERAHDYAKLREIGAYSVYTDTRAQNELQQHELIIVKPEYR
jgi:hypothetical protein